MSKTSDPQDRQPAAKEESATGAPHERELRLALVCYGGVSLAVYMHGITKEILKLVRASRASHDARTFRWGANAAMRMQRRVFGMKPIASGFIMNVCVASARC